MAEGREGIAAFSTERESLVLSGAAVESVISMTCEGGLGAAGGEEEGGGTAEGEEKEEEAAEELGFCLSVLFFIACWRAGLLHLELQYSSNSFL